MSKNLVQNWMPPAHVVQMPSHANGQMIGAMKRSDFGVWNKRSWSKVGATAADCSSVPGCRLVPLHSYQRGEIYGHIWYCMGSDFRQTKGISSSILWILLNHIKPFHVWSAWSNLRSGPILSWWDKKAPRRSGALQKLNHARSPALQIKRGVPWWIALMET